MRRIRLEVWAGVDAQLFENCYSRPDIGTYCPFPASRINSGAALQSIGPSSFN
jgi:hypothetical protein